MKNGNLVALANNKYRLRYKKNNVSYSKNFSANNLTEAKKIANDIINSINENNTNNLFSSNITFNQLTFKWFEEYYKPNFTPEVVRNAKISLNSKILPRIGTYKLCDITPSVLNDLINTFKNEISQITHKKLSPATIKKLYNYISSIFNYAVRMEIIEYNPCTKVKLQFKDDRTKKLQFYTVEQVKILFDNMKDEKPEVQLPIMLAVYGGLRRSEIYGIKWSDIDLKNKTIHIQRSRLKVDGKDTINKTKTLNSNRTIPINSDIIGILNKMNNKNEFVFDKPDRDIVDKLHRIQYKANLPKIKFHDLRHTSATLLLANGIDVKTVSEFLGHSNISTTSIYVHAIDDKFKNVSNTFDNILK